MIDLTSNWLCLAAGLTFVARMPAFAQSTPSKPAGPPQATERERPITYGMEIAFRSGHADRGFILSDRAVVQPVLWLSGKGLDLSVWGNLTLAQTTDSLRPQIMEVELTGAREWRKFTIGPALRMYVYHDPLSDYSSRSLEGWLYLSYQAGPVRLFSNHSVDVVAYPGAYYGEAGVETEGPVARGIELGGSVTAGWASATFNDAWAGVLKPAFERMSAATWLTIQVTPHLYIEPHFELSAITDPAVRPELLKPTYFLFRLSTGAEF